VSAGVATRRGAWIRYGGPLTEEQIAFAAGRYRVAILQPWERAAAARLKDADPDTVTLAYKCLSSTRRYEPGPIYTSGLSYAESEEAGEHLFAHRLDGERIAWARYPGHWQMAVWEPEYQRRWVDRVATELAESPFDGVMADNDVFDDYYGLRPPIEGGREMPDLRRALDDFVPLAGRALNAVGKLLVPNIAESRRDPGRWNRHAAYGGGFEEVFLAYEPDDPFDPATVLAQVEELGGPGITVARIATDGTDEHPNFLYGLAAFWVFAGDLDGAFTGTAHDGYSATPWIPQLDWDLGTPVEGPRQRGNGWKRQFTGGWAAVNLGRRLRRAISWPVPAGLVDADGLPAPRRVTVGPHRGVVYRCPSP
jgi:hypothetical protein